MDPETVANGIYESPLDVVMMMLLNAVLRLECCNMFYMICYHTFQVINPTRPALSLNTLRKRQFFAEIGRIVRHLPAKTRSRLDMATQELSRLRMPVVTRHRPRCFSFSGSCEATRGTDVALYTLQPGCSCQLPVGKWFHCRKTERWFNVTPVGKSSCLDFVIKASKLYIYETSVKIGLDWLMLASTPYIIILQPCRKKHLRSLSVLITWYRFYFVFSTLHDNK